MNLEKIDISVMLSHPIQKGDISLHVFRSTFVFSAMSYNFLHVGFCTLFEFIPKCFFLLCCYCN